MGGVRRQDERIASPTPFRSIRSFRKGKRGGLSRAGQKELDDLARWVCMVRAGAALFTDEGRDQWWGECQRCERTQWLSWCHVFTRAAWSVRWDPDNAFAWCSGCHRHLDQHWEEKRDFCIQRIGENRFSVLKMRAKGTRPDYAGVRVTLEQEKARLLG